MNDKLKRLELVRSTWDAYHPDYMDFQLLENPDFHKDFADGAVMLNPVVPELAEDVSGQRLLDICCACDATQAFSWANLGADVTACDISPAAIKIARENAELIGLPVAFDVADAQTLGPIADESFDIVYASYLMWFEDIDLACRNWYRVLRPGGRLLIDTWHPVTYCLEDIDGRVVSARSYNDIAPDYREFDGTNLARRQGGWGQTRPIVEFHHTIAEIMNAALAAGFRLERVEEPEWETEGALADLPGGFTSLWQK
jgi:ubiquinone/menaquinone biosynthesis C-methylase UbiE